MKTIGFWSLLSIEIIKTKRSKILPLIAVPPLLVVLFGVASISKYLSSNAGLAWEAMFVQSALLFGYYLLPFSLVVVCAMISGRESANNGMLRMLSLPIERHKLALCKFIALSFYLLIELMIFFLLYTTIGLIITKLSNIAEPLPLHYILKWSVNLFLGAVPSLAVMWLINVIFDKKAVSIGLNFLLILPGVFVANTSYWPAYPYCYNGILVSSELYRLSGNTEPLIKMFPFIPIALLIFVVAILIILVRFGKKEVL